MAFGQCRQALRFARAIRTRDRGEGGIPAQLAGRAHVVAIRPGAALPQITIAIPMPARSSAPPVRSRTGTTPLVCAAIPGTEKRQQRRRHVGQVERSCFGGASGVASARRGPFVPFTR